MHRFASLISVLFLLSPSANAGWDQINNCTCKDRPGVAMPVMGIFIYDAADTADQKNWLLLRGFHYSSIPAANGIPTDQEKQSHCQSLIVSYEKAGVCNQKVWR